VASHFHQPVLVEECLTHLGLAPGSVIVDGTVGGGGHAAAILERTSPDGVLIGFDVDSEALAAAAKRLEPHGERVRLVGASFRDMDQTLPGLGFPLVDGVLLDLGVSSHQLDTPRRGFRFSQRSGDAHFDPSEIPLDMRLDPTRGPSAADFLEQASEDKLLRCFREFGELPGAHRLVRQILEARRQAPIRTSEALLRLVRAAGVGRGRRHNPATLVFQALRIAVNDELEALCPGLDAAVAVLRPGGHLVVIAYHSLEDRRVKQYLRLAARGCSCPPDFPQCVCGGRVTLRIVTRRPVSPGEAELRANPRARSARMRAAQRVEEAA